MIKSVTNYPVSQLFDIESNIVYTIPRYQREYSWFKGQWENLFDDVLRNDPGYFLGSIICINQTNDTLAPVQSLELVDGQQRLTTLSLLFAAVYKALKDHDEELDEDQRVELVNMKRKLVLRRGNDQMRVIPQVQNYNLDDYRFVLSKIGAISDYPQPSYASNRRILRAYRYFRDRIKDLIEDKDASINIIMDFLDKVNQASLVKIEVASHADAYILFESLNNRGMPLTAVDLIKNKLLARLEQIEPGRIDYYFGKWNDLLKSLGDDYTIQERFFRQYYNAFKDELREIYNVPVATRSNLIQIFEKLIDHDAKLILEKLIDAGKFYALFLSRNQDEENYASLVKPLKDLERIQGSPSYLLLLHLMVHRERLQLADDDLVKIIEILVRFFVRRNLTDTPPTRDLTRLFMAMIEKISAKTSDEVEQSIFNQLVSVSASDEEFRNKLYGPIYEENSGVTRFILCALEEQSMTRETLTDLWRMENKQFVWTIEHIFPQGNNIPKSWVEMIAGGDEQKARNYQEVFVHNLGNLTISGFNSALGNKSFEEKRDRQDRQGRFVGYKNGLKLNEDLATAEDWNINKIDERSKKLVEQVMELFKMNRGER